MAKLLSIVVPVYNEQDNLRAFHEQTTAAVKDLNIYCEFIIVDDGSTDTSAAEIAKLHDHDPRVRLIRLTRNFGYQSAVTAGLDFSSGDAAVVLNADLQHPPELIQKMVKLWEEGYDVVYTERDENRHQNIVKERARHFLHKIFKVLTRIDLPKDTTEFKLLDRKVISTLKQLKERNRFHTGLTNWVGYKSTVIPFKVQTGIKGVKKRPLLKEICRVINDMSSFSSLLLHWCAVLGSLMVFLTFFLFLYASYGLLFKAGAVPTWSAVIIGLSLFSVVAMTILSGIALYIAKTYMEVKQRPVYIVHEKVGIHVPDVTLT